MFLSKILILSCMIILYIVEENIFVIIVYKLLVQKILKRHVKDCFKINGKQRVIMPKEGEYVKFKNYEIKLKPPFIIFEDFESILVPENNGKQNSQGSYTNKY